MNTSKFSDSWYFVLRFLVLIILVSMIFPLEAQIDTSNITTSKNLQIELELVKHLNNDLKDSLDLLQEKLRDELYTHEEYLKHRKNRFLLLMGGLIILLISIGLWSRLRYIQKTKKELQIQKLKAEKSEQFEQLFLANMSHEIRTPLNAILGMTNLTLDSSVTKTQSKYLAAVKHSSENLLVIINDILDLSKIEAGKLSLEKIPFHLSESLKQVQDTLRFKAEEKGLILKIEISNDVPDFLIGDPARLIQILINLCGNAIKFTHQGQISLDISKKTDSKAHLVFQIKDTGIGIPSDALDRLFKKFHQLDASVSRKYGGTGLGLSISKSLVEMQGGSIHATSVINRGSTFFFDIPYALANAQEVQNLTSIKAPHISGLKGIRILIAEDNEYNGIVIQDTLEHLIEDANIVLVTNGKLAIEEIEQNEFDIILMDAQMPVLNGIEATKQIRNHKKKLISKTPIIALTASVFKQDIQMCLDAGMLDYIPKPFKREQLINTLLKYFNKENARIWEKDNPMINEISIAPPPHQEAKKVTNLKFLKEFCEGDQDRIKKYISMYLKATRENIEKIKKYKLDGDMSRLTKSIHQMLAHFQFMGMDSTWKLSKHAEQQIKSDAPTENIYKNVDLILANCIASLDELSESDKK